MCAPGDSFPALVSLLNTATAAAYTETHVDAAAFVAAVKASTGSLDAYPCEVCVDAYLFNLYNIKISPGPGGYACYGAKAGRQECQTAALLIDSLFQGCAAGPEILSSLTCSDSGAALACTLASLVVLIGAFL